MRINKKGFTIIEIVLVLAIGGLIFLMVFVALPSLQRSQRNTQRRRDVDRVLQAILDYQKHNSGKLPFTRGGTSLDTKFAPRYLDSNCTNPKYMTASSSSGETYYTARDVLYTWTYEGCSDQFRDPDGTIYALGYAQGAAHHGNSIKDLGAKHIIVVATNTRCGSAEGELEYSSGVNDFVVTYSMEGDQLYCVDNT